MAVEDRLLALEHQLRVAEDRIRADLRERNIAWLELYQKGMLVIAKMIVEATSRIRLTQPHRLVDSRDLLVPDLQARAINVEEYRARTPEKLELVAGYLFDTAEHPEARHRLLNLLLVNVGLLEVVRLAPEDRWREALERVYGTGARSEV